MLPKPRSAVKSVPTESHSEDAAIFSGAPSRSESNRRPLNCAGVNHLHLNGGSGRKRLVQGDHGLRQSAGMVDVALDCLGLEFDRRAIQLNGIPMERRGKLQCDSSRGLSLVL